MRPVLKNMLARVNGGAEEVLFIKKDTLRELLLELEGMCVPAAPLLPDESPVICRPNRAGAGFTLSVDSAAAGEGTHDTPYVMEATASILNADTWDVENPPPGTDGVQWDGPRFNYEVGAEDTSTDSNGDTTDWTLREQILVSRTLTFSSTGKLVAISAEFEVDGGSFSFR